MCGLMVMLSIILLIRLQLLATTTAITVSSFHQSLSFSYVRVNANNHVSPLLLCRHQYLHHSSSITTSSYCSRLNPLRNGRSKEDNIFRHNNIQSPRRRHSHCNGGMTMLRAPLFLTAAATASLLFASTSIPLESRAYYTTTTATTTTSTIMEIQQYSHPTINLHSSSSSVLQLASSTVTNPIGELKVDDTDTAAAITTTPLLNNIGQWFFVLYVAVSLLAGTKEIVGRLQKKLK